MEQIAYLHDVHLRYGCFCNPGACRRHLDLLPEEVIKQYEVRKVVCTFGYENENTCNIRVS